VARSGGACAGEVQRYERLVKPYTQITVDYVRPETDDGGAGRIREERRMCGLWPEHGHIAALTQEGRICDSLSFARWIGQRRAAGVPLVFNVGGAYGLTDGFKKKCHEKISLSAMTFPHHIALLVMAEQIYRAFTILKGHPYHK
jgi:23S rRNA (pseudouridine1915-N3)-methyltransferase